MTPTPTTPTLTPAAREYLLTLADDEHMIGAHHTAWIGLGPFLEEDLAFCSIAQDELGHAIALYAIVTGSESEVDSLALGRAAADYRSSWLAEWPCETWATALVRHWLYDRAEALRWDNVADSSVPALAAMIQGVKREEAFHLRHAEQFLSRVFASTAGSEALLAAFTELWPLAGSLFAPPITEADALLEGVAARSFAELEVDWRASIRSDLERWGASAALAVIDSELASPAAEGGDRTIRSPHFEAFHAGLNEVVSIDPTAVW